MRRYLALTALAFAVLAGGWLWWQGGRPLITRAVDIGAAPAEGFDLPGPYAARGLPDGTIVGLCFADGETPSLVRYDPRTRASSALSKASSLMAKESAPRHAVIAPDGRSALWLGRSGIHMTALDGTRDRVLPIPGDGVRELGWQADSRGWYALVAPGDSRVRLVVSRVPDARAPVTIELPGSDHHHALAGGLADGRILVASVGPTGRSDAQMYTVDPTAPPAAAVRRFACPPPVGLGRGWLAAAFASPRGDRLVWAVEVPAATNAVTAWVRRVLRLGPARSCATTRVYGTRIDGSHARLVMELPQDETDLDLYGWTADDRHLLLARRGRLLRVPTE